jgi:Amt family ammonium transporter
MGLSRAWGLGWLDAWATSSLLRDSFGSNNGMIDLGGSGVIHLVGGLSALVGALLVGPRAGRFDEEGKAREIYSGNGALQSVGALLVLVGFFGLTCGRVLMLSDGNANVAAKVAVNVTIAAASSCIFAVLISVFVSSRFELAMALQGKTASSASAASLLALLPPYASAASFALLGPGDSVPVSAAVPPSLRLLLTNGWLLKA